MKHKRMNGRIIIEIWIFSFILLTDVIEIRISQLIALSRDSFDILYVYECLK